MNLHLTFEKGLEYFLKPIKLINFMSTDLVFGCILYWLDKCSLSIRPISLLQ